MSRGKDKRNCCLPLEATGAHERSPQQSGSIGQRTFFVFNLFSNFFLCRQAPDEAAETVNLSQKVLLTAPEEAEGAAAEGEAAAKEGSEEDKNLPEWSEKVASGILTGGLSRSCLQKCLQLLCSRHLF